MSYLKERFEQETKLNAMTNRIAYIDWLEAKLDTARTSRVLHDSLGSPVRTHSYEIVAKEGEWWINHKQVGSGEPLKQWIIDEIDGNLTL